MGFTNKGEGDFILHMVNSWITKTDNSAESLKGFIGVVTMFPGQRELIRKGVRQYRGLLENISIVNAEELVGTEFDVLIVSIVQKIPTSENWGPLN